MNSLPEQFNFAEHLFALNRARGDRIAYIDDQGTLSYSALEDRARRLAAVSYTHLTLPTILLV